MLLNKSAQFLRDIEQVFSQFNLVGEKHIIYAYRYLFLYLKKNHLLTICLASTLTDDV